jgi:Zn-dependent M28 family amino/carboxypeptidase
MIKRNDQEKILGMTRLRHYSIELLLVLVLAAAVSYFGFLGYGLLTPAFVVEPFSGDHALSYVEKQLEFGERSTGSPSNSRMGDWLIEELRLLGWDVVVQPFVVANNVSARNIIAIRSVTPTPASTGILMTHYDTRMFADRDADPDNHIQPTLGANAGGSGTAVLLELARTLDVAATGHTICLVFLDAESNGDIEGWEGTLGSTHLVERLDADIPRCRDPRFGVYLDMVGGQNERLFAETTSYPLLTRSIWEVAKELGYGSSFINEPTWTVTDAHSRLREIDVPAITISDYSYPHRATMQDTFPQLSAGSLEQVGNTLKTWLEQGAPF